MDCPETVGKLAEILRQGGYLADRGLTTALFVALSPQRPILLEGEVGVGKTEAAIVNSVLDALRPLGVRHADMPPTPANVWSAIQGRPLRTDLAIT
jgi:hypothetical protein